MPIIWMFPRYQLFLLKTNILSFESWLDPNITLFWFSRPKTINLGQSKKALITTKVQAHDLLVRDENDDQTSKLTNKKTTGYIEVSFGPERDGLLEIFK